MPARSTAILVVDDHPIFMIGIRNVLQELAPVVNILEATTAEIALEMVSSDPFPDFICLDMQLPGLDGIAFLGELRNRKIPVPVIALSASASPEIVHRALSAGASGYLSKATPREELLEGFRAMLKGGRYVARSLRAPLDYFRVGAVSGTQGAISLTRRQRQVLDSVAAGLGNRQIAENLSISESTVKGHLVTLFSILDADNRTACVAEARKLGLLS
jgi:DNA-binding NarL/FixJ family response regulator